MRHSRSGFTLIEVLVAVTILAVGVVAMAGSSAAVTRMIGRGKIDTRAAQLATRQVEALRLTAYSTTPRCTALANGGPVTTDRVALSWTVAATGTGQTVNVSASYRTARGARTQVLTTYIEC
ncbi:MAG TPA: prepilin-type N-terminal cleavage/methylation domain-containing protein [Gemmatimonadales bacterium]|nr:prepilin-type N-terminal cleavage/methylation domain-containing protein [Gemmatimonadales bacterium]